MTARYHYQIGFPEYIKLPTATRLVRYSLHASSQAKAKGIHLPTSVDFGKCRIVEIETEAGKLIKIVARLTYSAMYDLVLVVNPGTWIVRTAWLNHRGDSHATLDRSKYTQLSKVSSI